MLLECCSQQSHRRNRPISLQDTSGAANNSEDEISWSGMSVRALRLLCTAMLRMVTNCYCG